MSGENAAWLNRFATITRLDLNEARNQLEQVLGGKLCCPLGGMYEVRQNGPTSQLISTSWGSSSRFDETSVPADYQLPFLMWLRKLTLDFELSATTLTSRVELRVRPTIADERDPMDDRTRTKNQSATVVEAVAMKEREQLYRQLLVADRQLSRALRRIDSSGAWNTYLAVPPQLPHGDYDWEKLQAALRRFQRVASDPRYHVITDSAGFAESHTLLKECIATIASDNMN